MDKVRVFRSSRVVFCRPMAGNLNHGAHPCSFASQVDSSWTCTITTLNRYQGRTCSHLNNFYVSIDCSYTFKPCLLTSASAKSHWSNIIEIGLHFSTFIQQAGTDAWIEWLVVMRRNHTHTHTSLAMYRYRCSAIMSWTLPEHVERAHVFVCGIRRKQSKSGSYIPYPLA